MGQMIKRFQLPKCLQKNMWTQDDDCRHIDKEHIYNFTFSRVYQKESFPTKESDSKILQCIYFAYKAGIISSYSNRINNNRNCTFPLFSSTFLTLNENA